MSIKMNSKDFNEAKEAKVLYSLSDVKTITLDALVDNYSLTDTSEEIDDWLSDSVDGLRFSFDTDKYNSLIKDEDGGHFTQTNFADDCLVITSLDHSIEPDECVWFDDNGHFELIDNHNSNELD